MKIAMIDPSLFTLPYDLALRSALLAKGGDVTLYGRVLRPLEAEPDEARVRPFFYKWSESIRAKAPGAVFRSLKGLEHTVDMARLTRAFRRDRPAIVHFQWLPLPAVDMTVVARIRRAIAPVVLTVHDMTPFNNAPTSAVQRIGSESIWREFDRLIVHGEESRALLAGRGLDINQITVIPHGILDAAPTRARKAGKAARLLILLFGRIKAYKGIDVMVEALGRLPSHLRAQCQVLVVGEPLIPVEPMKQRAAALGIADSLTWDLRYVSDEDMSEVFDQADIFAFPYREIDTSGVLMSCLPYGKPIIASGIGAFQTLLQDGTHGCVIPPNDPVALADAIGKLLTCPSKRQTYGRNVARLSAQIPSWDAIADQTMALYETLDRARTGTRGG